MTMAKYMITLLLALSISLVTSFLLHHPRTYYSYRIATNNNQNSNDASRQIVTTQQHPFTIGGQNNNRNLHPSSFFRQRKSIGNVQMMGLFGLGAPEIAIILVAAAFLLGPQKLAELGKEGGKIAGNLKDVPKEFQKGLEEGEIEAKSRVAKPMENVVEKEE